ncbi:MAG: murein L,D-transpeptidase [Pseudonocardiales bacterium]|nr:MAG: murein L,D-transpeptidase [Pseudonocardiales bacterium]
MAKRVAVLGVLVVAVLAGCGADLARDRTSASSQAPPAAVVTPAEVIAAAPRVAVPKAKPKPNACVGNAARQLVLVSVTKQRLWLCAAAHLVYSAAVTTGIDTPDTSTPTGSYQIQAKETDRILTLLSGAQYQVNYWIPFDAPLFGFHDSSWQRFPYGSPRYRTEGSHGCIHTPLAAMKFLYNWADIGAAVTIRP